MTMSIAGPIADLLKCFTNLLFSHPIGYGRHSDVLTSKIEMFILAYV